jgi:PIN domain nuclease of toxin-antitoxin system
MRLLLDTHVFLWWLDANARLSRELRSAIEDPASAVFVSAASIWEIAVKASVGKLALPASLPAGLDGAIAACGFDELPITARHAALVAGMAFHHADPFDRLLIAQAQAEDLTLATADKKLAAYGLSIVS